MYTAKIGLAMEDPVLARLLTSDRTSALHVVAHALSTRRPWADEWILAGITLVLNGADLCTLREGGKDMGPQTPLLAYLCDYYEDLKAVEDCVESLKVWTRMFERANVNLQAYYAEETRTWSSTGCRRICKVKWHSGVIRRLSSIAFDPDAQLLSLSWSEEILVRIMRLHQPPGTYHELKITSDVICWQPTAEEEEEGRWLESERLHLPISTTNQRIDVQVLGSGSYLTYYHESPLSYTQDDNGFFDDDDRSISHTT